MTRYAIYVSVEEYGDYTPTPFCHRDANALRECLTGACDYAPEHSHQIISRPGDGIGPDEVLYTIQQAVGMAAPEDTVLFFFAGHGRVLDEGRVYLLLANSKPGNLAETALPLDRISNLCRKPGVLCVRILDACHSGTDVRDGEEKGRGEDLVEALSVAPASGWITMASCGPHEKSHPDPELQHGVFTHALLCAVTAVPVGQPDGIHAIQEDIAERVGRWARDRNRVQTPAYLCSAFGRPVLAIRRPQVQTQEPDDLEARLDALRTRIPVIAGEKHRQLLTVSLSAVEEWFVGAANQSTLTKFVLESPYTGTVDRIPEIFHKEVIAEVERYKLAPLHKLKVEQAFVEEERLFPKNLGHIMGALSPRGKWETRIEFEQGDLPSSVVMTRIKGDGYVPSSLLFAYLVPLHFRAILILAYAFRDIQADSEWRSRKLASAVIDVDEPNAFRERSKTSLDDWFASFQRAIRAKYRANAEYLLREFGS